jgi:prevent-host-death family protein
MTTVSVAEAKNRLSELIALAEAGESVCVTRRGKLVARLEAVTSSADRKSRRQQVKSAFARLRVLREGVRLKGDLKSIAREGLD